MGSDNDSDWTPSTHRGSSKRRRSNTGGTSRRPISPVTTNSLQDTGSSLLSDPPANIAYSLHAPSKCVVLPNLPFARNTSKYSTAWTQRFRVSPSVWKASNFSLQALVALRTQSLTVDQPQQLPESGTVHSARVDDQGTSKQNQQPLDTSAHSSATPSIITSTLESEDAAESFVNEAPSESLATRSIITSESENTAESFYDEAPSERISKVNSAHTEEEPLYSSSSGRVQYGGRLRNVAYIERKKEKRRQRVDVAVCTIPDTPSHRLLRDSQVFGTTPELITRSAFRFDAYGGLSLMFLKGVIPTILQNKQVVICDHLASKHFKVNRRFTDEGVFLQTVSVTNSSSAYSDQVRGQRRTIHMGMLKRYNRFPYLWATTTSPQVKEYISASKPFFEHVKSLLLAHCPFVAHFMKNAPLPPCDTHVTQKGWTKCTSECHPPSSELLDMFAGWSAHAMVDGDTTFEHIDKTDYHNSYCGIVPLGDYDGGDLLFPDLNLSIRIRPGDFIVFRSHLFRHLTNAAAGGRFSLVFFNDQHLYNK